MMAAPVTVTIQGNVVSVDQQHLQVRGQNQQLQWNIQTAGWTFPQNGIAITPGNGTNQFRDPVIAQNGTRFILWDNNSSPGQFKYTVNVTNGQQTLSLDPYIVNEGQP
jgi:hypothetical protein